MKKTLSIVSGLFLAVSAFGSDGLAQLTLSVSTSGPDVYADGQQVQVGETYLLVYIKAGATFQGLYSDGTLVAPVNNQIVTKAYAVAGAKCGFKAIQYPADLYPAGGSWVIVLLDTRTAANTVGGLVAGHGASVATAAASSESTSLSALNVASQSGGAPALTTSTVTPAPAGTPAPVITAVEPNNGTVNVRFKNISTKALYEVQSTTDLGAGAWQPVSGGKRLQATAQNIVGEGAAAELPASVQVPANDKVRFFRVIVPGAN